jgi:type I restriction enzyme M protein
MSPANIVQKLWNYCDVLRDDGMGYGDYVEQLTYLLFLKMADERSKPPYNQASIVPENYNWQSLLEKDGDALFDHYRHVLENLGKEKGLLGLIFAKSQNKFQDPSKLRRLIINLINNENWSSMSADVIRLAEPAAFYWRHMTTLLGITRTWTGTRNAGSRKTILKAGNWCRALPDCAP